MGEGNEATGGDWLRRRLAPTAAVCLAFLGLHLDWLPGAQAQFASNLLQLALAATAALACWRTARGEPLLARWFFLLIGAGMALWASGQVLWMLLAPGLFSGWLFAVQYAAFVSSSTPLIMACVVRPDRPRPGALGLAADVGLVCVLALFVCVYFPVAAMALGAEDPYLDLSPLFYNPQRLMLLVALLWLLRGSTGAWRRLYDELALAMAVFHGVGLLSNRALFGSTYRPGLYDLPWALPFLWIALAARDWAARPRELPVAADPDPPGWDDRDWQAARHGNIVAIGAVALVPAVHQLAVLLSSPPPALARLRGHIALGGTLLVGGLYLARQLHTLRRAENTQRVREERFRALVENSADAIGVVDAQGLFRYVSATSERVTGFRPDELAGRSPLELAQAGERPELGGALLELRASPGSRAGRAVRYQHRDGSLRHGALAIASRLDTPAVSGVVLHLRDVTEQRRAEEERVRSRSLLEATLESTADGILVVGRDGRITRFNQRFAAMWRLPPELLAAGDAERSTRFVLDQLQEPQDFLDRLAELYAEPESEGFDTLRLRDGRVIERYSLPQRLAGEVMGRVYSFRDVSERTHAEQAMARLVAILEATPDFVGTSDAAGRALYLNRAGRRMLGIGDDEPLGDRHIAQFHPAPAAARVLEEAIPTALREGAWSGESRLQRADGREIPVLQVVLAHRSPHGEVEFLSTLARDISQRIEAERELRRSHTMAALGSLVAGVAHEVRNPLFGISSTLDAFEARFTGQDDHREYVGLFRQQLDRLTHLMNDLLEYGKATRLRLGPGRFEAVIDHALAACAPLTSRAGVGVATQIAPDLPELRMDERRLSQVLRNLLENAVQHSPRGGTVNVRAALASDAAGAWLECTIEDDGPGFQLQDLPHLFEPFFTRRHGGTGLGLSIVQRIVADHGGSIEASNRAAGGARFRLRLPALGAAESAS
ncbi:MAG TPA: PAS domain S-box protein [Vicinamibacteria bacterium]